VSRGGAETVVAGDLQKTVRLLGGFLQYIPKMVTLMMKMWKLAFKSVLVAWVAVPLSGLFFTGTLQAAEIPSGLPVDFSIAVQVIDHQFDPRDEQQWKSTAKFMPDAELKWVVQAGFLRERARAIYVQLYNNGGVLGSNAGTLQKIVEAGQKLHLASLDILVSQSVFLDLQRTAQVSKGAVLLFRVSNKERALHHILVNYLDH
jgi:hypothetical protein